MATKDILMGVEATIVGATASLDTADQNDFMLDVARGEITGLSPGFGHGRRTAVSNTEVMVNDATPVLAVTATALRVRAGGNPNDTAAGTGARTIVLVGIDAAGAAVTDTISLLGALVSLATANSYHRLNKAYVETSGTFAASGVGNAPTGNVLIETTAGSLMGQISAGQGESANCMFTTGAAQTAYIKRWACSTFGTSGVTFRLCKREVTNVAGPPFVPVKVLETAHIADSPFTQELDPPLALTVPLTDIYVTAIRDAAGSNTCSASFELIII